MFATALLCLGAYLLGSISCAILVCKIFRLPDPRAEGSKNPGATNVLRIGGKLPAALTLLGDALKGFLPVFSAKLLGFSPLALTVIGSFALFGHLFPIFFQFRGGKGVATLFGILYGLHPILGLLATGTWIMMAALFRYSSLAALIMVTCVPFYAYWLYGLHSAIALSFVSLLIYITHRSNILNLIKGTEGRIFKKKIVSNESSHGSSN